MHWLREKRERRSVLPQRGEIPTPILTSMLGSQRRVFLCLCWHVPRPSLTNPCEMFTAASLNLRRFVMAGLDW